MANGARNIRECDVEFAQPVLGSLDGNLVVTDRIETDLGNTVDPQQVVANLLGENANFVLAVIAGYNNADRRKHALAERDNRLFGLGRKRIDRVDAVLDVV